MRISLIALSSGLSLVCSRAEEHNAENLLVIQDAALAEKYTANWQSHLQHSEAYAGKPS